MHRAIRLGFDRNDYPGDGALKTLRQTFTYTGYWLNNPPGARANSWKGKRKTPWQRSTPSRFLNWQENSSL